MSLANKKANACALAYVFLYAKPALKQLIKLFWHWSLKDIFFVC